MHNLRMCADDANNSSTNWYHFALCLRYFSAMALWPTMSCLAQNDEEKSSKLNPNFTEAGWWNYRRLQQYYKLCSTMHFIDIGMYYIDTPLDWYPSSFTWKPHALKCAAKESKKSSQEEELTMSLSNMYRLKMINLAGYGATWTQPFGTHSFSLHAFAAAMTLQIPVSGRKHEWDLGSCPSKTTLCHNDCRLFFINPFDIWVLKFWRFKLLF